MGVWNQLNSEKPSTGLTFRDLVAAKGHLRDKGNWELLKGGTAGTRAEGMAGSSLRGGLGYMGKVFHPERGRALEQLPREQESSEPARTQGVFGQRSLAQDGIVGYTVLDQELDWVIPLNSKILI